MKDQTPAWLTTEQAAAHLNKPASWLYENASRLAIPRSRLGNHYRYRSFELDQWLEGNR